MILNMLTDQDIKKLIDVFATREELDNKFDNVIQDFSNLQTAIDSYAKKSDTYFQEMLMLAHKVDRQEKWIHQIAEKLGLRLEY